MVEKSGWGRKFDIRLNCEATPELVKTEKPDVLIIAAGSDYAVPPGLAKDAGNFVLPVDVLLGLKEQEIGS
jgi:hypothetical protein